MKYGSYITFCSWEDRFLDTVKHDINANNFEKIIVFYYGNGHYPDKQKQNRDAIKSEYENTTFIALLFGRDIDNWKEFNKNIFLKEKFSADKILINVSTMPRNIIYYVLHFLDKLKLEYEITYYNAISHSAKLTQNPLTPYLILQHSGIFELNKQTILIACVGYDEKRILQLYNYFEPKKCILLTEQKHRSMVEGLDEFSFAAISKKEIIVIDSFENGNIYKQLTKIYQSEEGQFNIILCSLGPKISAVELYRFQKEHEECGLVYIASKDYAEDYSTGVDLEKPIIYK